MYNHVYFFNYITEETVSVQSCMTGPMPMGEEGEGGDHFSFSLITESQVDTHSIFGLSLRTCFSFFCFRVRVGELGGGGL